MKRYLNKFSIIHRETRKPLKVAEHGNDFNQVYVDSYDVALKWLASFCAAWKLELHEFKIVPADSFPIETRSFFNPEENELLKREKVFSGKGLKNKTFEKPRDATYKPGQFQPKEVRFAESATFFKGSTTLPKQKRQKNINPNDVETYLKVDGQLDAYELTLPEFSIEDKARSLMSEGLNKTQVYRLLKNKYPLSNTRLHRIIGNL